MKNTFGVAVDGEYRDISNTLQGAKNYATRHGFKSVYTRFSMGYIVTEAARKINGKWENLK